jgi:phosphoenolpyruvate phosphomutase
MWTSGFELLASQALPDVSLVAEGQHLGVRRYWVSIAMVMDIDADFGNAINVPHAVEQYERAAAMVI